MPTSKDPGFDALFPKGARVEKVMDGFQFTEGPVWREDGSLLFTDIPANKIYRIDPEGLLSVYSEPSGNANGLTIDRKGRLIRCEHGNRRVLREEKSGSTTVLASYYKGKRLNSPNDVVERSDGSIFFTDPPYGVDAKDRELEFQGVYRISPGGDLSLLVDDFRMPNGLALSPDEKVLYIADSSELKHIRAFDVQPDGSLANGRLFAEMRTGKPGSPDGMKVDSKGRLWSTGEGGVWVFDPSGKHLGTVETPEVPANCAWGGKDGKTLYMTCQKSVYIIRTEVAGLRPWIR